MNGQPKSRNPKKAQKISLDGLSKEEVNVKVVSEIAHELIQLHSANEEIDLTDVKKRIGEKYKLRDMPKLVDIIAAIPEEYKLQLLSVIKAKPVRTASGVAVVAVMCKPHRCPHITMTGNICVYCPGGPDSDFEYSTQSYTGYEPTSMRAIRARYNPYLQARCRIDQLKRLGHSVDKIEYIIMGGTFMSLAQEYREFFIRNLHDALSGHTSNTLAESIRFSEQSKSKCVGITIETRPDYCLKPHLSSMLVYGCTRLEVGVQSIYEFVARDTNRGHTVRAVQESFHLSKDCGFKIIAHMMPNLPSVSMEMDILTFRELFDSPKFRVDGLKIYPTLVIRGTGLYEMWKQGKYRNYDPAELVELVANILALVPPWTRVYRIQRDIPMPLVTSGVDSGNLRELALHRMDEMKLRCRDVRTREVGQQEIHKNTKPENVELVRRDYCANNGWETFLAYEDVKQDILIGLLRLRKCSFDGTFRPEVEVKSVLQEWKKIKAGAWSPDPERQNDSEESLLSTSMVRELHVYGTSIPLHLRNQSQFQHQGYGTQLMVEAERIAREEHNSLKLAVISGVGTRNYYRKLGFELDGPYMSKWLR